MTWQKYKDLKLHLYLNYLIFYPKSKEKNTLFKKCAPINEFHSLWFNKCRLYLSVMYGVRCDHNQSKCTRMRILSHKTVLLIVFPRLIYKTHKVFKKNSKHAGQGSQRWDNFQLCSRFEAAQRTVHDLHLTYNCTIVKGTWNSRFYKKHYLQWLGPTSGGLCIV